MKISMRSFVAVALAAAGMLVVTTEADARSRREVEDAIRGAKADCVKKPSGAWQKNGVLGYICTYHTGQFDILQHFDSQGVYTQVCYRLDVDAPWTCS
ncbi:MAG: hypothetical protein ACYC3K_16805 [Candidatus Nanopelagicales bacterium]